MAKGRARKGGTGPPAAGVGARDGADAVPLFAYGNAEGPTVSRRDDDPAALPSGSAGQAGEAGAGDGTGAGAGAARPASPASKVAPVKPHYDGHRERLRTRFLERGSDSLDDYELLELLLFAAIPRRDVKPLAKKLLAEYGSLWAVVNAPVAQLRRVHGFSDTTIATLTSVGAVVQRALRSTVVNRPVLSNWQALLDYCYASMSHLKTEQFRLLFLNRKNVLIADEVQQVGTVDHTPVYPREVVKRAIDLGASALILVHNHPSGDPTPSRDDIEMTRHIAGAADAVGVTVHDHVIIGQNGFISFKGQGLL